jgi:hypothetical protein
MGGFSKKQNMRNADRQGMRENERLGFSRGSSPCFYLHRTER